MSRGRRRAALAVDVSHVDRIGTTSGADLFELARAVEAGGADQIVVSEHVALAHDITDHPGASSHFPYPGDEPYPEPLVTLAAMGAVTNRVRLSTNILIAPLRPAVLLAKAVATVDHLSGGRLDLGVGSGWHREEFAALGVPLEGAVARMEDAVRACQALWRDAPASFESPTVSFTDMHCSPRPVQRDIPIWFGGGANRATARRIARIGHGWSPMGHTPAEVIRKGLELLHQECEAVGRDPGAVGVRIGVRVAEPPSSDRRFAALADAAHAAEIAGATVVQVALRSITTDAAASENAVAELVDALRS